MHSKKTSQTFILPEWPAPENVRSLITTCSMPVFSERSCVSSLCSLPPLSLTSLSSYKAFNLATHVKDDLVSVEHNRAVLKQFLTSNTFNRAVKTEQKKIIDIQWLSQIHSKDLVELTESHRSQNEHYTADGSFTSVNNLACTILTADCLPVLICDKNGEQVAAVHAGWQGLVKGIITDALLRFSAKPEDLLVYLGPAISANCYEVGESFKTAFENAQSISLVQTQTKTHIKYHEDLGKSFTFLRREHGEQKYMADLFRIAQSEINGFGCFNVYGGDHCSASCKFNDKDNFMFYSYRRDGITGRMASLIWKSY